MKSVIKKWGNSVAVRIPAAVLKSARMKVGEKIDVRAEAGRIVIEPVGRSRPHYTLEELVAQCTPANRHELIDFGPPQGEEIW